MSDSPLSRSGTRMSGRNTVSITQSLSIRDVLAAKAQQVQEAIRPSAQAGAEVLSQAVVSNVARRGTDKGNLHGAVYQVYSQDKSGNTQATYHVSWNHIKAPHGHLLEFGWLQRYVVLRKSNGKFVTAVRPEMIGKPKPKRNASQAAKDAYYVPLPGGPRQIPARAFVRGAQAQFDKAMAAAKATLDKRLEGGK
jgi:hypothetical protein